MSSKIVVIKLGTSSIISEESGFFRLPRVSGIVDEICELRRLGFQVVFVSSGSIGLGRRRLGVDPDALATSSVARKQAFAAVGQSRLMAQYDMLFEQYEQKIAQVLLSRLDFAERARFSHVRQCFQELLSMGVVPIVNENDSVSVDGVKFGDNDTLAGLVTGMLQAAFLFILTDVDGLYSSNPRVNADAQRIAQVTADTDFDQFDTSGRSGSSLGTGGMSTKLMAARLVSRAGSRCAILSAKEPHRMLELIQGSREHGTVFEPSATPLRERKWWILFSLKPAGELVVDDGAAEALQQRHGLHAVGVRSCSGGNASTEFSSLSCVTVVRESDGALIGRGLVNFSSAELERIKGMRGEAVAKELGLEGDRNDWSVIHYRNFVINE